MRNTLDDLNNALFQELENLQDLESTATEEQLNMAITRSRAVSSIAEAIIHNGELALKTMQHLNEYGYGKTRRCEDLAPVPRMLSNSNG